MAQSQEIEHAGSKFSQVLDIAAQLPGVRINRAAYLRAAFRRHCTEDEIQRAIAENPAAAGIPLKVVTEVANTSIAFETGKVSGISAVAGIPGGLFMIGTVPADMAQYIGHMLRVSQKLAYVYSWPSLFGHEGEEIDEATEGVLILFVGVMTGVQLAQRGLGKVSTMIAGQVVKKLPQRALTKGAIYPIVKKVAGLLGVSMTKRLFASGIAKFVPVVGAVLSGGLTLGTFLPMSKRLQKHLASFELARPIRQTEAAESINVDDRNVAAQQVDGANGAIEPAHGEESR